GRRWFEYPSLLWPEHVAHDVFLSFHQIDHRAGDCLLALERGNLWRLAEHRIALVHFCHLRRFYRFVTAVVIEDDLALVADYFVSIHQRLGARITPVGIDVLDIDLS